jgi:biotin carboxylase
MGNNDPAMPMVAFIAEELGLVGNSSACINSLVSKYAFRQLQEQAGLYCPKHVELENDINIDEQIKNFTFPVIVKPSVSAGSQGTTKIQANQTGKLQEVFNTCKDFSRNGKVTIEEYVEMPTLEGIEGDIFVFGDIILWNGLFTTRRSMMAPMIPMTYIFPAILSQEKLTVVKKNVTKLFNEVGIRHGEYNIEGISLSMPAIVGKDGVETHVPIQLNKIETESLKHSANTLCDILVQNGIIIS